MIFFFFYSDKIWRSLDLFFMYIVKRSCGGTDFSLNYTGSFFQVTELSPEETGSTTGGYGKSISHVIIGLKTVKGTKQLKLDPTIYDALIKEKVK